MIDGNEPDIRARIVAEAYSWLRTPYIHLGDIKGIGADCAMLLVRVYVDLGVVPAFDPRPYEPEWFLHRDEERYLDIVRRFAHEIPTGTALPGDVDVYNFGRHAAH